MIKIFKNLFKSKKKEDVLTPKQYFDDLKSKKEKVDDAKLDEFYENCLSLINKYDRTGQKDALKKLMFHIQCIEKERELVKKGFDTFIYKKDVEEYIEKVPGKVVKCIEMHRYEREIPEDIVKTIEDVRDIFDEMLIVFTDYTKDHVEKTKKEKDPILFGMFINKKDRHSSNIAVVDRLYFLGDWEDEYCDLTLDKMVAQMKTITDKDIEYKFKTPEDLKELNDQLFNLHSTSTTMLGSSSINSRFTVSNSGTGRISVD